MKDEKIAVSDDVTNVLLDKIKKDASAAGYNLNPDGEFAKALIHGLAVNEKRYGYPACPCRLAEGIKEKDLDIICPCDYRDADITDFGACFCGLYVSKDIAEGKRELSSIPERRPAAEERKMPGLKNPRTNFETLSLPVWRCKVCGYLCARPSPPEVCPICKVKKDRFEKFLFR